MTSPRHGLRLVLGCGEPLSARWQPRQSRAAKMPPRLRDCPRRELDPRREFNPRRELERLG
jgi:hypothetical protein